MLRNVSWPAYNQHNSYGVPDLELDVALPHPNNLRTELHTDGAVVVELELLLEELQQQAALADAYVRTREYLCRL